MSYNEPTLSYEFLIDLAFRCWQEDLKFILKTNAFINKEPWKEICQVTEAINIDWKGSEDNFKSITGVNSYVLQGRIKEASGAGVHIEISIPLYYKDSELKRNEYQKKWRKDNYESYQKNRKKYREKNKEKITKQQKEYIEKNEKKMKEYYKQYVVDNRDKINKYSKKHYNDNKDRYRKNHKKYYEENKENITERHIEWQENNKNKMRGYYKKYDDNNKDKRKAYRDSPEAKKLARISGKKHDDKRRKDPIFRFNQNISRSINLSLKKHNLSKGGRHWEDLVGYTSQELRGHLESLFQLGMTWENKGDWHIDHRIPKSFFQIKEVGDVEFRMCWRLENLQPLWAFDNISKKDKIIRRAM